MVINVIMMLMSMINNGTAITREEIIIVNAFPDVIDFNYVGRIKPFYHIFLFLFLCLSVCLSVDLYVYLFLSISLLIYLFVYLSSSQSLTQVYEYWEKNNTLVFCENIMRILI